MSSREGHVALVTGAGTGIGAATARLLADRGMDLALAGRRPELLEETARAVEAAGRRALVLPGDLAHAALPKQLVEETVQALGRLDVLVNNAATIAVGPLGEFTLEHIDRHLAVNTRAPLLLTQEATSPLSDSPDGAIVNVSSSVGSIVKPGNGLYGMTKAAPWYLTRASAYEFAGRRIRVNCIAPGPVKTPILTRCGQYDLEAAYADLSRRIPLGRMAVPEEVAVLSLGTRRPGHRVDHGQRDPRRRPARCSDCRRRRAAASGPDRSPPARSSARDRPCGCSLARRGGVRSQRRRRSCASSGQRPGHRHGTRYGDAVRDGCGRVWVLRPTQRARRGASSSTFTATGRNLPFEWHRQWLEHLLAQGKRRDFPSTRPASTTPS